MAQAISPLHERLAAIVGQKTFRAVAAQTDHNPETIRRYLQGQAPSVEFIVSMCTAYDVSADWLLTGRGPMRQADARTHALQQANPAELLAAIAQTLESLEKRVDRIESYMQTMEARLRVSGAAARAAPNGDADSSQTGAHHAQSTSAIHTTGDRSRSVASAIAQRPHPHSA